MKLVHEVKKQIEKPVKLDVKKVLKGNPRNLSVRPWNSALEVTTNYLGDTKLTGVDVKKVPSNFKVEDTERFKFDTPSHGEQEHEIKLGTIDGVKAVVDITEPNDKDLTSITIFFNRKSVK